MVHTSCKITLSVFRILLVIVHCNTIYLHAQNNNVCRTMEDYTHMEDNRNCWYNYIVNGTVPENILRSGRPLETHKVTTEDGYILTMFRIPNNKRKNPVLLQHGLISSSANWIALGEESLAFQLYDNGYDVWLGNYRGCQYSEEHVKYTINDDEFWDFSLDELYLDVPAMLNKIVKETQAVGQIVYIGHSLGTSMSLIYSSERASEAAKLLKLQILAAPAYKLNNIQGIPKYVAAFDDVIYNTINHISGLMRVVSKAGTSKLLSQTVCLDSPEIMQYCMALVMNVYGAKTSIKPDKYPLYLNQHPSGASLKLLKHIADLPKNHFRKFNYGFNGNMLAYNVGTPPIYDVSKIKVPTVVICARNDQLTPRKDAIILYKDLSPRARKGIYEIVDENFNHIDYLFGDSAKCLFVDKVLRILEQ